MLSTGVKMSHLNMYLVISKCTGWSKSLCAPDDYSTKNTKNTVF